MSYKPAPDENGKIPCDCCRNGFRKCSRTRTRKVCQHCEGTGMRTAPSWYTSTEQDEEAARIEEYNQYIAEQKRFEEFKNERKAMTLEKRLEEIEEAMFEREFLD